MPSSASGSGSPATIPVTLDSTVGGASANSYADRDQATACLQPFPQFAQWFALTPQQQDFNLITATFYLETRYRWYGKIFSATQALQFPRTLLFDRDGRIIPAGTMPNEIIKATSLIAAEFANTDLLAASSEDSIQRVESGSVEVELAAVKTDEMLGRRFPHIENLLHSVGTILDLEERECKIQFPRGF